MVVCLWGVLQGQWAAVHSCVGADKQAMGCAAAKHVRRWCSLWPAEDHHLSPPAVCRRAAAYIGPYWIESHNAVQQASAWQTGADVRVHVQ